MSTYGRSLPQSRQFKMDSNDWKYLAEGGANIVFRYSGSESKYDKKVLRIRKRSSSLDYTSLLPEYRAFIYRNLNLMENSNEIDCISVSKSFLEGLNVASFQQRPEHRRIKAEIDSSLTEAILLPDLLSESFSCEIKPKWSGLNHLNETSGICSCRYCLAQISKGRRSLTLNYSNSVYCPKLFFSKNSANISNAVFDLFRNPSNQFRLFVNSVAVATEDLMSYSDDLNPIISKILAEDPILQEIIEFQDKLLRHDDDISVSQEDYRNDLESLLLNIGDIKKIPFYLRVLLVMTIRDASIIISFKKEASESFSKTIILDEIVYHYKIDMIDLDIKPLANLERYFEEIKLHG